MAVTAALILNVIGVLGLSNTGFYTKNEELSEDTWWSVGFRYAVVVMIGLFVVKLM